MTVEGPGQAHGGENSAAPWAVNDRATLLEWIVRALREVCQDQHIVADISLKICAEIVDRFRHDIDRLLEGKNENKVHPAKYAGYLSFWLRKLKPLSNAYLLEHVEGAKKRGELYHQDEIIDVNEVVSTSILALMILTFAERGDIPEFRGVSSDEAMIRVAKAIRHYFNLRSDVGHKEGTILEAIMYDMRYRTFGPHHLVHTCYTIISIASLKDDGFQ